MSRSVAECCIEPCCGNVARHDVARHDFSLRNIGPKRFPVARFAMPLTPALTGSALGSAQLSQRAPTHAPVTTDAFGHTFSCNGATHSASADATGCALQITDQLVLVSHLALKFPVGSPTASRRSRSAQADGRVASLWRRQPGLGRRRLARSRNRHRPQMAIVIRA
jgi:hypothetical protein